jgi:hypothetical protein
MQVHAELKPLRLLATRFTEQGSASLWKTRFEQTAHEALTAAEAQAHSNASGHPADSKAAAGITVTGFDRGATLNATGPLIAGREFGAFHDKPRPGGRIGWNGLPDRTPQGRWLWPAIRLTHITARYETLVAKTVEALT